MTVLDTSALTCYLPEYWEFRRVDEERSMRVDSRCAAIDDGFTGLRCERSTDPHWAHVATWDDGKFEIRWRAER